MHYTHGVVMGRLSKTEIRVPLLFVLSAAGWILLSDSVVTALFTDVAVQQRLQTYKGLFFVTVISVLLYTLIRHDAKRDEARLLEIRNLHEIQQSIFTAMQRVFFAVDEHWNITMCNPSGLALLGISTEAEVVGKKLWGLLPANLGHAVRELAENNPMPGDASGIELQRTKEEWWAVHFVPFAEGLGIFLDNISERKAAEFRERELIQQREESLRRLEFHIDRLPIGYIITDQHFRFRYLNPAAERIFGFSSEELSGCEPYGKIIPAESRDFVESKRAEWIQGGDSAHGTNLNLSRDRGAIYCEWFNTPIVSEEGEFLYLISMVQDVTERFVAGEALRKSEQRYRALVEDQNEFIVRWQPDGKRSFVNQSYSRFKGMKVESLLRMNQFDVPNDTEAAELQALLSRFSPEAPSFSLLQSAVGGDRTVHELLWSHRALFGNDGAILEIQSVARDITEQVKAERELRRSEERYRALFENASEGILIIEHGLFTSCNRSAAEILGYRSEDIIGRSPEEISPEIQPGGERSDALVSRNLELALAGRSQMFEWEHLHADGRIVTVEVSLGRIMDDDNAKIQCFWRDVTERKLAEENLRESRAQLRAFTARLDAVREEERKQLSRELHDGLGQTLTALKIDISLMKRFLAASQVPPEQLETIDSMSALVDGTLRMSRALAGSLRPALLEEVGLERALSGLLSDTCGKAGLEYDFSSNTVPDFDPQQSLVIYRIAQEALTNVLRHAHATKVSLKLMSGDSGVSMAIEDDGIGIDPRTRWRDGGLGIVGMRERAEQVGASLTVQPMKGSGTRVRLALPTSVRAEGTGIAGG